MKYTVMINDESGTVYEQVIESDNGLVKAAIKSVLEYVPRQEKASIDTMNKVSAMNLKARGMR
jgi:hypothetical protein